MTTGTTMSNGDEVVFCKVCGVDRGLHTPLNHKFSTDGTLVPIEKLPPQSTRPQTRVVIANAVDMELRDLLIRKGVLTYEDFGLVHHAGTGVAGDQGTGGAPATG